MTTWCNALAGWQAIWTGRFGLSYTGLDIGSSLACLRAPTPSAQQRGRNTREFRVWRPTSTTILSRHSRALWGTTSTQWKVAATGVMLRSATEAIGGRYVFCLLEQSSRADAEWRPEGLR